MRELLLWCLFFWCAGGAVVLSLILVQRRVLAWRAWRDRCMTEAAVVDMSGQGMGRVVRQGRRRSVMARVPSVD